MTFPATLTWRLVETLKQYGPFSKFNGEEYQNELDNLCNAFNDVYSKFGPAVADINELRAIQDVASWNDTDDVPRVAGQVRLVKAVSDGANTTEGLYEFISSATPGDTDATDVDTDGIVNPDAGTGYWKRVGASHAIVNRGVEALRTLYANLKIDNSGSASSDIVLKLLKRTAGTVVRITADSPIELRNNADSAYQDLLLKALTGTGDWTTSGNISTTGTGNISTAGTGNISSAGTISSTGNATFSGEQVKANGTVDETSAAAKALFQVGGNFTNGSASGNMEIINAPNAFAGYLFATAVNDVIKNIIYSDGRMKGTAGSAADEFITKAQMEAALVTAAPLYGDGSDGAVVISGNTTLTGDKNYTDLTIDAGVTLTTAGFSVFYTGTLTLNGTINFGAGAAGGNASGGTGGTAGTNTRGSLPVLNGVAGQSWNGATATGSSANIESAGANGSAGGAGSAGGLGDVGTTASGGTGYKYKIRDVIGGVSLPRSSGWFANGGAGGGAYGGGNSSGGTGTGGGGSGAAGQTGLICGKTLVLGAAAAIIGIGGNGGTGANGSSGGGGTNVGNGGGGAGGSGSLAIFIYVTKTGSFATTTLTGGTGGAAGTGGPGSATAGANGATGIVVEINL